MALLGTSFLSSVSMIFSTSKISFLTSIKVILISTSLSWVNSLLTSQFSHIGSIQALSRKIPFYSTLAVLAGVSSGPILSTRLSYGNVWLLVAVGLAVLLIFMNFVILPQISSKETVQNSSDSVILNRNRSEEELWQYKIYPLVALAIVWIATGFFQVYEVRILIDRFGLDSTSIGGIFALTLIANLIAVHFVSPKIKNHFFSIAISGVVIIATCLFYLFSSNLNFVVCLIFTIGLFNGLFNVGYTNLILNLSSHTDREGTFLISRLVSQSSLLCSTVLATIITISNVSIMIFFLVILTPFLLFSFRIKMNSLRSVVPKIFIVVFLILSNRANAGDLTVLVPSLPKTLDPKNISDTTSALIANQVYQKLYRFDENNFLTPELAESIRWSDHLMILDLTIKNDIKFSDGSPLVAESVLSSLISIIKIQKEQIAWVFGDLKGFNQAIKTGKYEILGVKVVDKFKLRFSFARPNPLFLNFLASPSVYIFLESARESKVIGSGSYTVENRSEKSWTLSPTRLGVNKLHFVTSESNREVDVSSFMPDKILNTAIKLNTFTFPLLQTVIMVFNSKYGRLSERKFRCHLASLFQGTLSDKSFYEWQPISLGLPFSWDIVKAQSGNDKRQDIGKNPITIDVLFANSAAHFSDAINAKVTAEFKSKGFLINFKEDSIQNLVRKIRVDDFQIALFGYVPDYPHLDALLTPFVGTGQGYNFSKYSNKRIDKFLSEARTTSSKDIQSKAYGQIFEMLSVDCPVGFLGTQKGKILVNKNIDLPRFSSLGFHTIDFSKIKNK